MHPYDVSKSCADLVAQMYAKTYGLPVCVTRCGNFYGGGDLNWNRIVPGTIRSVLRGERPVIRSDGQFVRDYFYVEDGVGAYLLLAEQLAARPELAGAAFNFSNELQITVAELVTAHPGGDGVRPRARRPQRGVERDSQPVSSTPARRGRCWAGPPPSRWTRACGDRRLVPAAPGRTRRTRAGGRRVADVPIPVVILCGGQGTRLAEQTEVRPKPLVEIGGRPILWHIMKHYSRYGFNEFVLALGYKGDQIKRYFRDYHALGRDMTISLQSGQVRPLNDNNMEPWTVHLVDTGEATLTGGRLAQLRPLIGDRTFMLTYGDGVGNVCLDTLLAFHRAQGGLVTLTAVRPPARFGALEFDGHQIRHFKEKSTLHEGWINGGFSVVEPARAGLHHLGRDVGARAAGGAGGRRAPVRVPARGLLAVHGHPARSALSGIAVGLGPGALEDLVGRGHAQSSRRRSRSRAAPHGRVVGDAARPPAVHHGRHGVFRQLAARKLCSGHRTGSASTPGPSS